MRTEVRSQDKPDRFGLIWWRLRLVGDECLKAASNVIGKANANPWGFSRSRAASSFLWDRY
ncbi:hypothetical protein [Mesorhizobium sp. ORS 3428]|uniref:hypothetical protein n=1 Tax=Mesorhizobium sp. ORS 3428 TaxID=540997 RepID=UPI00104275DC|nr:hypothetical protein [Mesorhizobium sp. ORS 3428]